jgi:flagellar protein FlaG
MDEASGRTVITVKDSETEEIIRQIPPESALALASFLRSEGVLESFGLIEKA